MIDHELLDLARAWLACRPPPITMASLGGAIQVPQPRQWPDAGARNDQAAYVVAAFEAMDGAAALLRRPPPSEPESE